MASRTFYDEETRSTVSVVRQGSGRGLNTNSNTVSDTVHATSNITKTIINVCAVNIEGFAKYKYDVDFLNYAKQYDIFGMCETWGSDQSDFDDTLHGYDHFDYIRPRSSRARRSSGGVTVFVKDSLINTGVVKRIFETLTDCVVLLLKW